MLQCSFTCSSYSPLAPLVEQEQGGSLRWEMPLRWALAWCYPLLPACWYPHMLLCLCHCYQHPRTPLAWWDPSSWELSSPLPGTSLSAMCFQVPHACFMAIDKTLQRLPSTKHLCSSCRGHKWGAGLPNHPRHSRGCLCWGIPTAPLYLPAGRDTNRYNGPIPMSVLWHSPAVSKEDGR